MTTDPEAIQTSSPMEASLNNCSRDAWDFGITVPHFVRLMPGGSLVEIEDECTQGFQRHAPKRVLGKKTSNETEKVVLEPNAPCPEAERLVSEIMLNNMPLLKKKIAESRARFDMQKNTPFKKRKKFLQLPPQATRK